MLGVADHGSFINGAWSTATFPQKTPHKTDQGIENRKLQRKSAMEVRYKNATGSAMEKCDGGKC